jgi:hypothetical protein
VRFDGLTALSSTCSDREPAERSLRFDFAHRPSFDPPVESLPVESLWVERWVEREALDGEPVEVPKGRRLVCGQVKIDKEYA